MQYSCLKILYLTSENSYQQLQMFVFSFGYYLFVWPLNKIYASDDVFYARKILEPYNHNSITFFQFIEWNLLDIQLTESKIRAFSLHIGESGKIMLCFLFNFICSKFLLTSDGERDDIVDELNAILKNN